MPGNSASILISPFLFDFRTKTRKNRIMKTKCLRACGLSIAAGGLVLLVSGCVVEPNGRLAFQPIVVAAPQPVYVAPQPVYVAPQPVYVAPQPVVEEPVMIPDSYVWDGVEFVGVVGNQYFYLGSGNVWLVCEPFRLERFHGWEGDHRDWRDHATRNDNYRKDAHGHVQPRHGEPAKATPKRKNEKNDEH
jgi:hypothetical protein